MLQEIDGNIVYVVEFDTMPELPITGLTAEESTYKKLTLGTGNFIDLIRGKQLTYAEALTNAIETGVITKPGKYGIRLIAGRPQYAIFTIIE